MKRTEKFTTADINDKPVEFYFKWIVSRPGTPEPQAPTQAQEQPRQEQLEKPRPL